MLELETQLYSKKGPVAKIFFNRPERRNATNVQFYYDLLACLDAAEADQTIRVIVLGGTGPVFCAGQDLKWSAHADQQEMNEYERVIRLAWDRIRRHPLPVIARVHGDALGGGMYMATRSDLIVMKSAARMAMREIHSGEQSGGTHLLTVGKQRAMEINLLGRYVTGVEAERWDLVNAVYDTEEEIDQQIDSWVEQLVALPPIGISTTKVHSNFLLDAAGFEQHWQAPFSKYVEFTEDRVEAKRAWVEKRTPVYKNR